MFDEALLIFSFVLIGSPFIWKDDEKFLFNSDPNCALMVGSY